MGGPECPSLQYSIIPTLHSSTSPPPIEDKRHGRDVAHLLLRRRFDSDTLKQMILHLAPYPAYRVVSQEILAQETSR